MLRKSFKINGLSIVIASLVVVQSNAVQAGEGMFRGRVNSMATGTASNSGSQAVNSAARQYQSSPASGSVVSRSAGGGQFQANAKSMSKAFSLKNNFATQSKVIAAPNGNTGYTGSGLPQSPQKGRFVNGLNTNARATRVIAAPNGNTGITGAGLPQPQQTGAVGVFSNKSLLKPTSQSSVAMYRNPVPMADMQAARDKIAASIPKQQAPRGILSDIEDTNWEFWKMGKHRLPPDAPPAGPQNIPVGSLNLPVSQQGNLVGLKPVGKGKNPAELTSRKEGAIDFGFERKPAGANGNGQSNTEGAIDFGFESKPAGSTGSGNGQGTPPAPAPAPTPAPTTPSPAPKPDNTTPAPQPNRVPQFPVPMPSPYPYPSGPVVISRPAPVIVRQPATEYVTPAQASEPGVKPVATSVDIVLEDLKLDSPATLVAGPAYRLKFRNQGSQAAGKFQVAILAGLKGKLADDAPRAIVEVPQLAAGEVREVTLRLPLRAMKLDSTQSQTTFTHLYVAVDFLNSLAELDESNNVAIVERSALDSATK